MPTARQLILMQARASARNDVTHNEYLPSRATQSQRIRRDTERASRLEHHEHGGRLALQPHSDLGDVPLDYLGPMHHTCSHCCARHFQDDRRNNSSSLCCLNGGLKECPIVGRASPGLEKWYKTMSSDVRASLRSINEEFAFSSSAIQQDRTTWGQYGQHVFKAKCIPVCSQRIATLRTSNDRPRYARLWLVEEQARRCVRGQALKDEGLVVFLEEELQRSHAVVQAFSRAPEQRPTRLTFDHESLSIDLDDGTTATDREDIASLVFPDSGMCNVPITFPLRWALRYPLLFPEANDIGWNPRSRDAQGGSKRLTLLRFARFQLQVRTGFNTLQYAGRLKQEFIVDLACQLLREKLSFVRNTETVNGSMCRIAGSPDWAYQKYENLASLSTRYGPPQLCITFTASPHWKEVTDEIGLKPAADHADIVVRVFYLKLRRLLRDIRGESIFGATEYLAASVEFQHMGLPHAHILVRLASEPTQLEWDAISSQLGPIDGMPPTLARAIRRHHMEGGNIQPYNPYLLQKYDAHVYTAQVKHPDAMARYIFKIPKDHEDNGLEGYARKTPMSVYSAAYLIFGYPLSISWVVNGPNRDEDENENEDQEQDGGNVDATTRGLDSDAIHPDWEL